MSKPNVRRLAGISWSHYQDKCLESVILLILMAQTVQMAVRIQLISCMRGSGRRGGGLGGECDIVQEANITHSNCFPDSIVWKRNCMLAAVCTEHLSTISAVMSSANHSESCPACHASRSLLIRHPCRWLLHPWPSAPTVTPTLSWAA